VIALFGILLISGIFVLMILIGLIFLILRNIKTTGHAGFVNQTEEFTHNLSENSKKIQESIVRTAVNDVCDMTINILKFIEEQKESSSYIETFLNTYLSKYQVLVSSYVRLSGDKFADDKTTAAALKLNSLIIEVRDTFKSQYNKILRNELGELDSTIYELEALVELNRNILD
jgi:hypothetical protein